VFQIAAGIVLAVLILALLPLFLQLTGAILVIVIGVAIIGLSTWGLFELGNSNDGQIIIACAAFVAIGILISNVAAKYGSLIVAFDYLWTRVKPTLGAAATIDKARKLAAFDNLARNLASQKETQDTDRAKRQLTSATHDVKQAIEKAIADYREKLPIEVVVVERSDDFELFLAGAKVEVRLMNRLIGYVQIAPSGNQVFDSVSSIKPVTALTPRHAGTLVRKLVKKFLLRNRSLVAS
jgi:hypothetical protein